MSYKYESVVNVIGHINPDTDSVCSAIAYANLKSQSTGEKYIPKRAGQILSLIHIYCTKKVYGKNGQSKKGNNKDSRFRFFLLHQH